MLCNLRPSCEKAYSWYSLDCCLSSRKINNREQNWARNMWTKTFQQWTFLLLFFLPNVLCLYHTERRLTSLINKAGKKKNQTQKQVGISLPPPHPLAET